MKTRISSLLLLALAFTLITGCTQGNQEEGQDSNVLDVINVVSREAGSGTRGAFVEIVGVLEKDSDGNETDKTYEEAIIQNGTDAVMTTVSGDKNAIGYISLGSLNDTVKALKINDVDATSENVQNNSYKISRPFNIAYKGDLSPLAEDFLSFILSSDGQSIIVEEGYVEIGTDLSTYDRSMQEGKLVIAGSTSVSPVMEKLAEKYEELNPDVSIEIQSSGSSAGMQSAMEGSADIGMASRQLKDSEKEVLTHEVIAIDGIAVIVNNENPLETSSLDNVKLIYTGGITIWNDIKK
jgi:phosphate transport system substrate-binding protein